ANGAFYFAPLRVTNTLLLRAAAFRTNLLSSRIGTHSYLFNVTAAMRSLPVLSLVTASNNLFGPTGILGINGGTYRGDGTWHAVNPGDYFNLNYHGVAWERPVSVELFATNGDPAFQVDAGIRVHGSDYTRPRYHATDKFAYRLYFRGDYGAGKLDYPFF